MSSSKHPFSRVFLLFVSKKGNSPKSGLPNTYATTNQRTPTKLRKNLTISNPESQITFPPRVRTTMDARMSLVHVQKLNTSSNNWRVTWRWRPQIFSLNGWCFKTLLVTSWGWVVLIDPGCLYGNHMNLKNLIPSIGLKVSIFIE